MNLTTGLPAHPNIEYIVITWWDKVAIVGGAIGFLFLVLMCMLCCLCPETFCCCCYRNRDHNDKRKRSMKAGSQKSTSSKGSYGSTESDYYYGSPYPEDNGGPNKWTPLQVIKEQHIPISDWSSDAGSGQEIIQLDKTKKRIGHLPNGTQNGDDNVNGQVTSFATLESGRIDFVLSYQWSEELLVINVIEVHNLKLAGEGELVSPYVKIRIYRTPKQFFTFRETNGSEHVINNLEKEMKTKMRRPGDILPFKETFQLNVDAETLKSFTICFLLCDMDKLSRHVTLGETSVALRKVKLQDVQEIVYSEAFQQPVKEYLGTISVGICYLPTSEKLYLTIEHLKDLKAIDKAKGSTDACVKIYLMYDGKQLKRVKTTVRASELNPVFNETFSFDVPMNEVAKVYFSLVVCHYNAEKKGTKVIGRMYIGVNSEARDQWNSMVQNPRKKIVQSYKICD